MTQPLMGFGVRVSGMPGPFAKPTSLPARPLRTIAWSARSGDLPPEPGPRMWVRSVPGRFHVGWADWAGYLFDPDAGTIDVTLAPPVTERQAALAFAFSVLPMLVTFWGLEPFHGSAVRTPAGALVVLGHPGAGKSTTALALRDLCAGYLSDDAAAIGDDGRLWPGPAMAVPRPAEVADLGAAEIYDGKIVTAIDDMDARPVKVAAIVRLMPGLGRPLRLSELDPSDAVAALLAEVRGTRILTDLRRERQLRLAARFATGRVAALTFDHEVDEPRAVATRLLDWATG